MQSLLARTFTDKPIAVVLDNDEPGQQAEQMLAQIGNKTGEWQRGKTLLNYHYAFEQSIKHFPFEAEDLWSQRILKAFATEVGEEIAVKNKSARPNPLGGFQYDFHGHKKTDFVEYLRAHARPEDCTTWIEFLEFVRGKLGLQTPSVTTTDSAGEGEPPSWPSSAIRGT